MSENLMNGIIELVRQGGSTALWIYALYMGGSMLKFIIGFGCLYAAVSKFCVTLRSIFTKEG